MKKCPFCAEKILDDAVKCKHCGEFIIDAELKRLNKDANTISKQTYESRPDAMSRNCGQNVLEQLEKLGQLKEKGILNDEEFQVQKRNLLCSNVAQEKPDETKREINVYGEYNQIPWYRRNGFIMLSFTFFSPVCFLILLTGEAYYFKNGAIIKYGKFTRALICVGIVILVGLSIYYKIWTL